jgi:hypothetical protein
VAGALPSGSIAMLPIARRCAPERETARSSPVSGRFGAESAGFVIGEGDGEVGCEAARTAGPHPHARRLPGELHARRAPAVAA